MLGKPFIKGTRMPVDLLVEKVAFGASIQELLDGYPFLKADGIRSALLYTALQQIAYRACSGIIHTIGIKS